MLGTIEELEKDIEQFQKNMAASGELQMLLRQVLEQIKQQNSEFSVQSSALISRVDNIPSTIENANMSSNNRLKSDVTVEIDRALQSFSSEQNQYLQGLEQTKQLIESYIEQSKTQERTFSDGTTSALAKFDEAICKIIDKNNKSNEIIKSNIDKLLNKRNEEFAAEQNKYIQSLQDTQTEIGECENKLTAKYAEFISTLENMNITNLYEQNIQLKNEFNKRTTLLMVISVVSIVVGIIGIIL